MLFRTAKRGLKRILNGLGHDLVRLPVQQDDRTADIDEATWSLFAEIQPYTMSGIERVAALRDAVEYVVRHNIPGDVVECGVWKGGSMMAVAKTLRKLHISDRGLYLFDTFEGMSPPTAADINFRGHGATRLLEEASAARDTASI